MAFCFLLVLLMKENKEIENRGQKRGMTVTEIIYLDIDGTLRDEWYGIPDSAKEAVQKCMDEGIFIVICTGRNPGSIQDDVKRLRTDGVISGGGCFIEFGGEMLKREYFPMRILGEFLEVIRKRKLGASLEAEEEIYMNEAAAKFYREDFRRKIPEGVDRKRFQEENKISYEDNFSDLWKACGKIHKICLLGKEEEIDRVREQFEEETETAQQKEWNGQWYIELLPKHCGKGTAVEFLNRYLRIDREKSMSFGDGDNDVDMLKASGTGIAVRGGSRKLTECADAVCESPMDDGIYRELKRRGILSGENGTVKSREKDTVERREKKAEEREKENCAEERRA